MSDFNIARKNMIQNQLMTNNITEENILNAFNIIPRELFLPIDKKPRAYLDENIEISSNRYLIEPRIISSIIKFSNITKTNPTKLLHLVLLHQLQVQQRYLLVL